jgi:TorA maturation chaperone TorD
MAELRALQHKNIRLARDNTSSRCELNEKDRQILDLQRENFQLKAEITRLQACAENANDAVDIKVTGFCDKINDKSTSKKFRRLFENNAKSSTKPFASTRSEWRKRAKC